MATISVRFNTDGVNAALDQLGQRGARAARRALKRTAMSVRTLMAAEVAKDTGLRVGTIRKEVQARIDDNVMVATVSVSGRRIPLIDFHARGPEPSRGTGRGVSALSNGQRKRYPNAFIATMRSGHRGVFTRVGPSSKKSSGAWSKNLPIAQLFGPSLPHVFTKYLPLGAQLAETALVKNLEHELSFALKQE